MRYLPGNRRAQGIQGTVGDVVAVVDVEVLQPGQGRELEQTVVGDVQLAEPEPLQRPDAGEFGQAAVVDGGAIQIE